MDIRNDYILRVIAMFIEMIRKMLSSGAVDTAFLDQMLDESIGIDVEGFKNPELIKHMIELSSANDENKKVMAIVCLYMKNKERFGQICSEPLKNMKWNLLYKESVELLETTFGICLLKNKITAI